MKKVTTVIVLFFTVVIVSAQFNKHIAPKSFTGEAVINKVKETRLPAFNSLEAAELDRNESKNGNLPYFARHIACNLNLTNGTFALNVYPESKPTGIIANAQIKSAAAQGLVVLFDTLYLPEGATLHVFSPDKQQVLGAFTHDNTPTPMPFNAGIIYGESCVIEYYEPMEHLGKGIVQIKQVGHAYRWLDKRKADKIADPSDPCEVDVACSEGNPWANQIRAVARIVVVDNFGEGFCTGTLVNNTAQNCLPYFLSAQHCSEGVTTAQFNQWIFYFNYQALSCNDTSGREDQVINGCTKIADSNDNGGDDGSDFLLLKLKSLPPTGYNVFYAGWNNDTFAAPVNGVAIHHPNGDIKKISGYAGPATSVSWGGNVQNTHWDVQWVQTANGHGVTEPGSSGAPLFDNIGLITGTLTGGFSYCSTPNQTDQFGKLSYHWLKNGVANTRRLKPWLDPTNTGVTTLAGTNAPCGNVSVQEPTEKGMVFNVSPNPSNGRFNLLFENDDEKIIRVFNYLGQTIAQQKIETKTYQLNLAGAMQGVYILQVETKGVTTAQKLIVE